MTNHPIERETHPMVERVAKAIAGKQFPVHAHPLNKRGWVERHWRLYTGHAESALSALRDLTPDVVEAGIDAWHEEAFPVEMFTAMINTILGERG